jgi:hypothetical protein
LRRHKKKLEKHLIFLLEEWLRFFFFKRENPFTKIKKSFPTQPKMFSV